MSRSFKAGTAVLLIAVSSGCSVFHASKSPAPMVVSGCVVHDATGAPLPGIRVEYKAFRRGSLFRMGRYETKATQQTDARGCFRFDVPWDSLIGVVSQNETTVLGGAALFLREGDAREGLVLRHDWADGEGPPGARE